MIRINRIKAAVAAVTVTGATAAAMLIPASPAVAFSSGGLALDVLVQSPGQLVANGAAVSVPVLYTCSGTTPGTVSVSVGLTERVSGNAIASGFGQLSDPSCTGEIKSANILVTAMSARAFAKGPALASGDIFGCSHFCGQQTENTTITIK
jgi:hypothetical protein